MDQSIDLSNNIQNKFTWKIKKYNECKKKRKIVNEILQFCCSYYKAKTVPLSGNKVIDDFIKNTQNKKKLFNMRLEFVSYDRFENVKFVAEGGFSKIYKATWIDGPMTTRWNEEKQEFSRSGRMTVALKELNNSRNINSKELNELKIFYDFFLRMNHYYVNECFGIYFGITQNPITQNFMFITKYYEKGDLTHYITKDFFNISWKNKLTILYYTAYGLNQMHEANIIYKDYHSGNIFIKGLIAKTGDFGLSKSAIDDDDNEIYGIIPYVAPEIFQGQKYTKASDIYGFGMIMWELMTGRRSFWDKSHDTGLIIEICDGLRPPIVTNAPEGYVKLMKKCWHSDPNKRPTVSDILKYFYGCGKLDLNNEYNRNPTKIIKMPDIGSVKTNNSNAIYKSRPLSTMIRSAESTRRLVSQNITSIFDKRKFNDNLIENNEKDKTKRIKLFKIENNDYLTKELELDINDNNINFITSNNNDYVTEEINFDI